MDHEDRPEGRLPSHTGICQPLELLPLCSRRSSLSVPCPPVWALDGSSGIHQDVGSCGPAVAHSGCPCPCLLRWLNNACEFSKRTLEHTQQIFKLLQSLGWTINSNTSMLQPSHIPDFLVLHFYLERAPISPTDSFLPALTNVLYPVSINGHACSQNFILRQDVSFCPVLTQWLSSPTLSPVLVQSQVVSPTVVMGYTNPVGCGLPHLPSLVSQTKCDNRRSVTSSGTQPVLLYGCIPDRMKRQLERPSDIRTMAAPESQHHIHWLELEAIRLALLPWGLPWRSQSVRVYCKTIQQ